MGKRKFNLILADTNEAKNARPVGLPLPLIVVLLAVGLVGLAGFGRIVYLGANYALTLYDAVEQRNESNRLKGKIESLDKFVRQETESITSLVEYEDNARLKYGLDAISGDVRKAGVGGFPSREDVLYSSMTDPLIVRAEALRLQTSALNNQVELQETTFTQVAESVQKVHGSLSKRPSIWPANGRITSTFGYRFHPILGLRLMHEGIDIANQIWTPIYATADGIVKEASSHTQFGNCVKLSHDNETYLTLYAHMQKLAVTQGQAVKRGDVIGYLGNTGRSTGPHLHYEVRKDGNLVNPMDYIVSIDQIVD
ncbi:MAG: M23 family metallopeptidase [Chitinispirillia bacterium]|nr:M23 family metallopeptidase [Chitinispirillia bacterium]MCL2241971.1 M23 family metallopeptidase [Chitinispirillia bacterium]